MPILVAISTGSSVAAKAMYQHTYVSLLFCLPMYYLFCIEKWGSLFC